MTTLLTVLLTSLAGVGWAVEEGCVVGMFEVLYRLVGTA